MDRNLHTDDFERLLREKSDEFRMYPSRRIWHSVYNNIHPGRKWPSIAMSITLLSILLLVGYLNTKQSDPYLADSKRNWQKEYELVMAADLQAPGINEYHNRFITSIYADGRSRFDSNPNDLFARQNTTKKEASRSHKPGSVQATTSSVSLNLAHPELRSRPRKTEPSIASQQPASVPPLATIVSTKNEAVGSAANAPAEAIANNAVATEPVTANAASLGLPALQLPAHPSYADGAPEKVTLNTNIEIPASISSLVAAMPETKISPASLQEAPFTISSEDEAWIENYALYNRPAAKKWANRLAVQLYITPSIVYRTLYNDPNWGHAANNVAPVAMPAANQDINATVVHTPSFGFELGTGLQYNLFKGVRLKGGLQVNYTRYNAHAFQNSHPIATKLTMHDHNLRTTYEVYRTTPYSNKFGLDKTKLHNETFQVSLPVGLDFRLAGTEELQFFMGVTVQPTYIAGGTSYLISSDRRNYVLESSMLNKWNLNAGFETFISYKVNGINWQIGPQFRTQLFSTNSNKFAIEERLMNFGIKLGMSKTLR